MDQLWGAVARIRGYVHEESFLPTLFSLFEELIDEESAAGADEGSDEDAVVGVGHGADGGACACSGANDLHGAGHRVAEFPIRAGDMLIGPEGFVEVEAADEFVKGVRRQEHLA